VKNRGTNEFPYCRRFGKTKDDAPSHVVNPRRRRRSGLAQYQVNAFRLAGSQDILSRWPCRGGGNCTGMTRSTVVSKGGRPGAVTKQSGLDGVMEKRP